LTLGARVEEFVYEKVQGTKPQRMLENDVLGQNMIDAGNEFGPGTAYGMSYRAISIKDNWRISVDSKP